jgi:hypothetical protein
MLSITHISFRQQEAELNVREPAKPTPHHCVAGWSIVSVMCSASGRSSHRYRIYESYDIYERKRHACLSITHICVGLLSSGLARVNL